MVPATVAGLVDGIARVDGNYSDAVEILRLASAAGALQGRFAIDPLPQAMRTYHRDRDSKESDELGPEKIDQPTSDDGPAWWNLGARLNSDEEK